MCRLQILFFLATLQKGTFVEIVIITEKEELRGEVLSSEINQTSHLNSSITILQVSRDDENDAYRKICQTLSRGVSLVADLTWTGWPRVQSLTQDADVPYVLVESPLRLFLRAVFDFLSEVRKASDTVIILENDKWREELLYLIVDLTTTRVLVLSGLDIESVQKLKDTRPLPSFYVVLASTSTINSIFNIAKRYHLIRRGERWILVFTDFDFLNFNGSQPGVTLVTLVPGLCCRLLERPPPCECPEKMNIIEHTDTFMKQAGHILGMVLQEVTVPPKSFLCNGSSPIKPSNGTDGEFYNLLKQNLTAYRIVAGRMPPFVSQARLYPRIALELTITPGLPLGHWSASKGLSLNQSHLVMPVKRFFRVGIIQAIPWSYRQTDPVTGKPLLGPDGSGLWAGYCLDFLERLAQDLNFDYELVPSDIFGVRQLDGTWTGLVGDLATGRTDLVVAPLTMTASREEVVDFVAPYFEQTGISIVIRNPERRTSLFKFMTVLRLEVWLSIVAALVVTAVMIWFLDKYSPYSARNNAHKYPQPCREFTLKESFWFAMTSFTPQGGGETPKALSGRTLVAAYWLFVVLMLATFTANLAAFLTVERMQAPIQSLEQLSRQSRINYTVVKNSNTHSYFRNMKHAEDTLYRVWKEITLNASSDQDQYRVWDYPIKEQYGHILQAIEKAGPVADAATGFAKVNEHESGWFALIHDAAEIRYEVYRNCNLTEVGDVFAEQPYAVAVQQGSRLNEEISRRILDLQKARYFETLNAKYWNISGKANCLNSNDNEGITLESLGGVFIATLFGLALAMVTLALEIFLHKRSGRLAASRLSEPPEQMIYPEYVTKKEFGAQFLQGPPSKLIRTIPKQRIITVWPRDQLY